ncbi:MAG: DUF1684 domain-containing protein [Actinomycetota bacterium]
MQSDLLDLAAWRRAIAELYATVRSIPDPGHSWMNWVSARDDLFREHPQSPLPADGKAAFEGLHYYPYDPSYRVLGAVEETTPERYEIPTSGQVPGTETMAFTRFAEVSFEVADRNEKLELYWLDSYSGGIFLPFRDATSGRTTYGACRYLIDSAKGADLGMDGDRIVLDFNFAYNPSCSYDARWVCPLAPPPNRLDMPIEAGERMDKL